jgi:formylmethanofuran dehydrogenase subunit D
MEAAQPGDAASRADSHRSFPYRKAPMPAKMMLIGGRSNKQGTSLCASKLGAEYIQLSSTVEMNLEDMARLGLSNDSQVRLRSAVGEVVVRCKGRQTKDLPPGILFITYGPVSSELMASDTAGTGMPISKNVEVEVEPILEPASD